MRLMAFLVFLVFTSATAYSQKYSMRFVDTKTNASFRGLSVADQYAIWVSGSKGWVGRSVNGGEDWKFTQVKGYENSDFRSLHAFDSNNAIIANAGSPAYILRTGDGGASWMKVYENTDSAAFFDGISFWGKPFGLRNIWGKQHGIIHGDPIGGRMLLLYTKDGGRSWKERKGPEMNKGEASFAASGTSIICFRDRAVLIATGGKTSRLFLSRNRGRSWRSIPTPMLAGSESTGIYSVITGPTIWHWLIAGGDYRCDSLTTANFFYTLNKGKKWQAPETTTRGYRECLTWIDDERPAKKSRTRTMFAVGPSGIDISADDGVNWKPLSDEKGFHVIKPSWDQNLMFLAGSNGKLAIMKTTP